MTHAKVSGRCSDGEIESIYLELAKEVAGADDYYVPRIIKKMANLEEARIIRELPASPDVIGEKLNLDVEKVKEVLKNDPEVSAAGFEGKPLGEAKAKEQMKTGRAGRRYGAD